MFIQDFVLNGQATGDVAEAMAGCRFEPGLLRPYVDAKGRKCVTVNEGVDSEGHPKYRKMLVSDVIQNMGVSSPVYNATSLRKQEWTMLDTAVLRAARQRLRAWSDLAAANTFGGFNGMSKLVLEHETMSDPGTAVVDLDGLTDGRNDAPKFQLEGLPLPITHSDFWFSARRLAVSRNTGTPIDSTMAEAAGRRVAEMIEKITIGVETGITFGDATQYGRTPTVYGYTNFPSRLTKTDITTPTGSNAASTLSDVLEMRDLLYDHNFYGPFMLYHSSDWDQFLDNDYTLTGGNVTTQTLRDRLRAIEGIQDVRRLDFFSSTFNLLLVQMTPDVARAVDGMGITTVQWESQGGMRLNFKVMCIMVPQLRADYNGNCGICHGTTS